MKNFALVILIAIAFTNCKSVENQQISNSNVKIESNSVKIEPTPTVEEPLPPITKKQQQKLDEGIPPKVREILDKASEINIYYNIDKETKGLRVLLFKNIPNARAKLSEASLKKRFLESFYYDVSSDETGALCRAPRHKITAEYNNRIVEIEIDYQCGHFKGNSSNGGIGGGLVYEKKSMLIMNEIIEKYGTDLQ